MSTQPILAGVDGSESALDAVRWAAAEAQELRAPLHLITVFGWVPVPEPEDPFRSSSGAWESLRENAEKTLAAAAAEVRGVAPEVEVTTELLAGAPADLLVTASARARLLVVGHRGAGGFATLVLGSVGAAAAAHAPARSWSPAANPGRPVRSSSAWTAPGSARPRWSSRSTPRCAAGPRSSPCTRGRTRPNPGSPR